ncbi:dihydrofolate reductase family protein [Streptomyces sp. NPDC051098]|uniref:dihydrofolate reductase family protein n=1 Tax=Streptomyces sp. NPDC051098 TaxID=3155411 RepID=UPI0034397FB4
MRWIHPAEAGVPRNWRWLTGRTKAACGRDIRIAGGAETIQEYLDSGLIDKFSIPLAPMLLGTGIRLSDRLAGPASPSTRPARTHHRQAIASATPPGVDWPVVAQAGRCPVAPGDGDRQLELLRGVRVEVDQSPVLPAIRRPGGE